MEMGIFPETFAGPQSLLVNIYVGVCEVPHLDLQLKHFFEAFLAARALCRGAISHSHSQEILAKEESRGANRSLQPQSKNVSELRAAQWPDQGVVEVTGLVWRDTQCFDCQFYCNLKNQEVHNVALYCHAYAHVFLTCSL